MSADRLRELYIQGQRDFHGWNLSRCNLSKIALSEIDLSYANLSFADLSETDLRRAELRGANLTQANLTGANLQRARLQYANLTAANLRDTDLRTADFSNAILTSANLLRADVLGSISPDGSNWLRVNAPNRKALDVTFEAIDSVTSDELTNELVTLCKALNAFHIACGGNGLIIDDWNILVPKNCLSAA